MLKVKTAIEVVLFSFLFAFIMIFVTAGFGWINDSIGTMFIGFIVSCGINMLIVNFTWPVVFKDFIKYWEEKEKVVEVSAEKGVEEQVT